MKLTRRRFMVTGTLATAMTGLAGYVWVNRSRAFTARFVRERWAEARRPVATAPVLPQPHFWPENRVLLCWLGHATMLIDFYGVRILTDPVFSRRIGLDLGVVVLGPKRFIAPALRLEQLPAIDILLLSHAHMDHLDLPPLRRFKRAPFTVTARATADLLAGTPMKQATELGWGDKITWQGTKGEVQIQAFEVKHWGARWRSDRHRGYNGYLLAREGRMLIFGGDTAYTPRFAALRSRGPFELAIMPIAGYNPWLWNHCTPEQALRMADQAGARYLVPVHHQTFKLSDEPMNEPMERMQVALRHEADRLALKKIGESFSVA
jgi:L-ascorbate metabolism protein UlaG (beta-lactamase superfamily)